MADTSASLLDRLQQNPHSDAWVRMVELYAPLIRKWLRHQDLDLVDADDVVQDVLAVVVRRLPEFRHNERIGAFRTWLKAITINCVREHWRARGKGPRGTGDSAMLDRLRQLEEPGSALSREWDREHQVHVTQVLLQCLRPEFEQRTWEAFEQFALEGRSAADVAAELGMTANAVFVAKSKILARLRQEAAGLLD